MIRGISNRRKYNAPQRRQDLADAAIQVLANYGARGLTHAKVDEHAGLPEGTTSYYFRTRGALQLAIIDRLNELDTGALSMMSELAHDDQTGYSGTLGIARLVMLSGTEPWLTRSRARFELILETRRNADIAAKIVDYGQHFYALTRDVIIQWHPPTPPPDRALIHEQTAMILTLINGIMLSYVAGFPAITSAHQLDDHFQGLLRSITITETDPQ
jgi:AcrR family transcriptional regulator